jgi:hypothetical protein
MMTVLSLLTLGGVDGVAELIEASLSESPDVDEADELAWLATPRWACHSGAVVSHVFTNAQKKGCAHLEKSSYQEST